MNSQKSEGVTLWISGLPGSPCSKTVENIYENLVEQDESALLIDESSILSRLGINLYHPETDSESLDPLLYFSELLEEHGTILLISGYVTNSDYARYLREESENFHFINYKFPYKEARDKGQQVDSSISKWFDSQGDKLDDLFYPQDPVLEFDAGSTDSSEIRSEIIKYLASEGYLQNIKSEKEKQEEEEEITSRLKNLGYI